MAELRRFADGIDAATWARAWIEGIALQDGMDAPGPCARRFENYTHEGSDGGTLAYFRDDRPIAVAVILRDTWNYSVALQVYADPKLLKQQSED
jgi:hypothetical protein